MPELSELAHDRMRIIARLQFLLVARIVFLIYDNNAEMIQGSKAGTSRPDQHVTCAIAHKIPLIKALSYRKFRMQNTYITRKTTSEAAQGLGRKGNFRHEHKGLFSLLNYCFYSFKIDFSFARSRNPIK